MKNHNVSRYAADPSGLMAARAFVERHGFRVVRTVKSQRRHHTFVVRDGRGKIWFAKVTQDPAEAGFLENETRANRFIRTRVPAKVVKIPAGTLKKFRDGVIALHEFCPGRAFSDEKRMRLAVTDRELEAMFQAMLALHRTPRSRVPRYFLAKARREFTHAKMAKKLWKNYLTPAIGTSLTREQALAIHRAYRTHGALHRFVHHDLAPWNILRLPDRRLALTDPEHARWGMKWYDVAYFYLQTYVLLNDRAFSRRALAFFVRRFKEELPHEQIEREIFYPLSYWIGACAFLAAQKPALRPCVKRLLPVILRKDFRRLLTA